MSDADSMTVERRPRCNPRPVADVIETLGAVESAGRAEASVMVKPDGLYLRSVSASNTAAVEARLGEFGDELDAGDETSPGDVDVNDLEDAIYIAKGQSDCEVTIALHDDALVVEDAQRVRVPLEDSDTGAPAFPELDTDGDAATATVGASALHGTVKATVHDLSNDADQGVKLTFGDDAVEMASATESPGYMGEERWRPGFTVPDHGQHRVKAEATDYFNVYSGYLLDEVADALPRGSPATLILEADTMLLIRSGERRKFALAPRITDNSG